MKKKIDIFLIMSMDLLLQAVKDGIEEETKLKEWIKEFIIKFTTFCKEQFGQWIVMHGGWVSR